MLSLCVASGRCIQTVITGSALLAISGTEEQYVALYRQTEELNGVVPHQQLPPHTTATAAATTASSTLPLSLTATATVAPATVAAAVQQHALIRGTGRTPGIRSTATSSSNCSSSSNTVHNDWGLSTVRHNGTSHSSKASHSSSSSSGSAAAAQKAVAGRDVVIADLGGLLFERRYTLKT
jgi:hypothetical protein